MAETCHKFVNIDGIEIFYREAGAKSNPGVLLLHGFPSSSIQYRYLLRALADRFHVIAPDFPAFGLSEAPFGYAYTFDNLATTTARFLAKICGSIAAVYLHDYGAHVGFRLLTTGMIAPRFVIVQNSEIYKNIGWKAPMAAIGDRIGKPAEAVRAELLRNLLTNDGIRKEFVEDLSEDLIARIDPIIIALAWQQIQKPSVTEAMLQLHLDYFSNIELYQTNQQYLRRAQPDSLILWGTRDQYISREGAEAYRNDLQSPAIQLIDGGHWLLETHSRQVNERVLQFLENLSPQSIK